MTEPLTGTHEDFLVIAQVLGPHGVDGELKCRVVTDFPERFKRGTRIFVGDPPMPTSIQSARVTGEQVLLKVAGMTTREQAAELRGTDVLVSAADAVELPPGQFLWRDLIGLRVVDVGGHPLGEVTEVLRTGANDVYVVRTEHGEMLVPAIKDVVKDISPSDGRMVVEPMPGMVPEPKVQRVRRYPRPRARRNPPAV